MRNRNGNGASEDSVTQEQEYCACSCFEGERLARLLKLIHKEIESTKTLEGNSLPDKFRFKQQFTIGVNEVTRVLERIMLSATDNRSFPQNSPDGCNNHKVSYVNLQVLSFHYSI
ncbi:hypothetical protein NC651_006753 [Populus alba x Populus x berolinensis]|nr:hypothetical protein NC651_006753 [Populus alba x Populus x berolinensis]